MLTLFIGMLTFLINLSINSVLKRNLSTIITFFFRIMFFYLLKCLFLKKSVEKYAVKHSSYEI